MTRDEIESALKDWCAAVVHFSHHANMREGGVFPADLQAAIRNHSEWPLSCCVVWPGHEMDLPGSVGVFFSPSPEHVISVSGADSGSHLATDGSDRSAGVPLTEGSFECTFLVGFNSYNEWRVKGARVAGIFVADPTNILVKQRIRYEVEGQEFEDIAAAPVSLSFVSDSFPDLPMYTMGSTGLIPIPRS